MLPEEIKSKFQEKAGIIMMPSQMQRFGISDEDDGEVGMDVKAEDDDDEDEEKNVETPSVVDMHGGVLSVNSRYMNQQHYQDQPVTPVGGARRCRPQEEKERTKLRERQRRAITAKILAGLRRHGNYNLRVRADINDVIAALAREAGWVVLPDGTTFPCRSQVTRPAGGATNTALAASVSQIPAENAPSTSLGCISPGYKCTADYSSSQSKTAFVPTSSPYDASSSGRSHTSAMLGDGEELLNDPLLGVSVDSVDDRQVLDAHMKLQERDFSGTPFVPVFIMLPSGVINTKCELVDPDGLVRSLEVLRSGNVDGVMVECWWGIVEAHNPQEYNWNGYQMLFQIIREMKMKIQVLLSFHECGGNVGDEVCIPLPNWVTNIGRSNPDIYFTDRAGRRNLECLSWGVDKERVLSGRTAVEVYFDYMRSFRVEFNEYFDNAIISLVVIGLGPSGELRYPSNPVKHGWQYPGIGEFQCYDQYLLKSLRKATEIRGQPCWARGPENSGAYNSRPQETGFFCDGGDYDCYYGRFFLSWYSQLLVDHGDQILSLAKLVFEGTSIATKISDLHWWYKTASHAAELTGGYYNSCHRDGYASIMKMLGRHGASLFFANSEIMTRIDHPSDFSESIPHHPKGLAWQILNSAWDAGVAIYSQSSFPYNGEDEYTYILERAKPLDHPDGKHFLSFTFLRLNSLLMESHNLLEFESFIKKMHGDAGSQYQT